MIPPEVVAAGRVASDTYWSENETMACRISIDAETCSESNDTTPDTRKCFQRSKIGVEVQLALLITNTVYQIEDTIYYKEKKQYCTVWDHLYIFSLRNALVWM